jgi:glucose-6-phosphate 1-dehydrogenase
MTLGNAKALPEVRRPATLYHDLNLKPNALRLRISPEILFALGMNVLGPDDQKPGQSVEMVAYRQQGADEPSAYERVLGDAMKGDATLFARRDYAEEAWRIVDRVLTADTPVHEYDRNTWGLTEVDTIVSPAGDWHDPIVTGGSEVEPFP